VPIEDVWDIVYEQGKEQAVYHSVYQYDEEAVVFIKANGTIKNFLGTRYISTVPVDIDRGQDSDEYTLQNTRMIVEYLNKEMSLKAGNYAIYYSGTGYHIDISAECFGFTPSPDLPFIVKATMLNVFEGFEIDPAVYTRTSIIRLPHTLNVKSELYKVPLTLDELYTDFTNIVSIASDRRLNFGVNDLWGDKSLEEYIVKEVPKVRSMQKINEPSNVVPCIQKIYNQGPTKGSRNHTLLRIASHFRRNGIPSDATKAALLHWNDNQLNPQIVIDKVESTYNYGYKYGCHDELLASVCSPKCIYYKNKDYLVDIKTAKDLQSELEERLESDFTGKMIPLAEMFGIDKDCNIYPGELVTIFGPTGANKTALAQNIALGYDFANDEIRQEWQIPTLYLSLELSGWYMHRRNQQIVSGMSKDEVNKNYKYVGEHYNKYLEHLNIQTVAPTPEMIQKVIRDLQPQLVVVDYIDLIEAPKGIRGEYEQVRYVSHFLSNLAVNLDIIIIQISQVSREYSRNQVLDIYAGKGSGAIENASRKVLGINGKQDSPEKTVSLFKNSDGDLFDIELEWTSSFRLKRRY
jgi:archaellum biogenesis ATPase FlaH